LLITSYDSELTIKGFQNLVEDIRDLNGLTWPEAYHIAEEKHFEAFKKNRFPSFEAFKTNRQRFLKEVTKRYQHSVNRKPTLLKYQSK
jgi:hypothetical protein